MLFSAEQGYLCVTQALQVAAKMSREVAEACEKINWAGVEEVFVFSYLPTLINFDL